MAKSDSKYYTVEELMKMAIEESHLSIPEHLDKTDPLVGAIVATAAGEVLAKAHRGELRVGEHCEYTLIERKLRDENLRGCVLYVTLEPCTDGSRKTPKRGCSTHVVKARFSTVYVGVEDPNPRIATEGIRFMERNGITVHLFPEHLAQIIRSDNAVFMREKEKEAMQGKQAVPEAPRGLLEAALFGKSFDILSTEAIERFLRASDSSMQYPSDQFNEWMLDLQFAEQVGDIISPTGLGMLLFGNHPENIFPQAVFRVEINYGNGDPEIRDFDGPLILQLPDILTYLREKALRLTINRSGATRIEEEDFPFEVLREAIANAIIHRDYTILGATNYLYLDPGKIIIRSPGEPQKPVTLEEMATFDVGSSTRNPKIMFIFVQMKLAEQRGIGLRNMGRLPLQGYPRPVFSLKGNQLEVEFGRLKGVFSQGAERGRPLSRLEEQGVLFLQRQDTASATEYAKYLKISAKTAQRQLSHLIDEGWVEAIGSKRWTKYRFRVR